jgi:hypothetical protein
VITTVAPARVGPHLNVHRLARHQLQTYQVWNSALAFGAALDSWNSGMTMRQRRYLVLYSTVGRCISRILEIIYIISEISCCAMGSNVLVLNRSARVVL